jgi:hypothetical protein
LVIKYHKKMDKLNLKSKETIHKIVKGFIISSAIGGITFLLGTLDYIDVDAHTVIYVTMTSGLLNLIRETLKNLQDNDFPQSK